MLDPSEESETYESASEAEVDSMLEVVPTGDVLVDAHGFRYQEPTLRTLSSLGVVRAKLTQSETLRLIQLLRKWMQQPYFVQPYEDPATRNAIHPLHTRWLFALLAHLDRRLSSEDIVGLRALGRACIAALGNIRSLRAQSMDTSDFYVMQQESGAWMLLTILAGVWGQRDLWDDAQRSASTRGACASGN